MSRGRNARRWAASWTLTVHFCLFVWGCSNFKAEPPPPFDVIVRVTGDPAQPVASAEVLHNGSMISTTKGDGIAKLRLQGGEGDSFSFTIKCPPGYQSPAKPTVVMLRRSADPSRLPEYSVSCPPTSRTVVVAIRAENGANLPVLHLGRQLARTDESGAAHVMLSVNPGDGFELVLSTADKGGEMLRPQNPSASFVAKQQDEVFAFDVKFTVEKKPVVRRPRPVGPTPLR